ncbi:MAG: WG repeat-containing protein [Actinomycetota bacterium]
MGSGGQNPFRPPKHGHVDRSGRTVIEPRFSAVSPFSEGMAAVRLDGGYGYIDIR